jgi:AmiR/NasT family two-component response regulator
MRSTLGYILLLSKQPYRAHGLVALLERANYSIAIANTEDQALTQALRHSPFLIILVGDHHHWSETLMKALRHCANTDHTTLVALTDVHAPSWIPPEENPGFDGFLVNPISHEVLSLLVQSAHTRQICCPTG